MKVNKAQKRLNRLSRAMAIEVFYAMIEGRYVCATLLLKLLNALDEVGVPDPTDPKQTPKRKNK